MVGSLSRSSWRHVLVPVSVSVSISRSVSVSVCVFKMLRFPSVADRGCHPNSHVHAKSIMQMRTQNITELYGDRAQKLSMNETEHNRRRSQISAPRRDWTFWLRPTPPPRPPRAEKSTCRQTNRLHLSVHRRKGWRKVGTHTPNSWQVLSKTISYYYSKSLKRKILRDVLKDCTNADIKNIIMWICHASTLSLSTVLIVHMTGGAASIPLFKIE